MKAIEKSDQSDYVESNSTQDSTLASSERRGFLAMSAGIAGASIVPGVIGLNAFIAPGPAHAAAIGPVNATNRVQKAYALRESAAAHYKNLPLVEHLDNGDEALYPNKIASYSKALPHDQLGEVDIAAYNIYKQALETADFNTFETIPMGGTSKLRVPQAAFAYDMIGYDSHDLGMRAAPTFDSAENAAEIAEVYWQAVTRDVAYTDYRSNPLTLEASADLSRFSDFRGPKRFLFVTPATLFRGDTSGDLSGPYISQFLLKDIPFGPIPVPYRIKTYPAGQDYVTTYPDWLETQNGNVTADFAFDPTLRYIRNARDMAAFVRSDFLWQGYVNAALIMRGMNAPLDPANPYINSKTQAGQNVFGNDHVLHLITRAANMAQKHAWFQKWLVHRRLRPEVFGGRIHNHITGAAQYPINSEILSSPVLQKVFSQNGTYLLPQAYPEGSPTHTAYPAAHACIAGACATILKAAFDESFVIPNPVVPNAEGTALIPDPSNSRLTLGGEVNKLANNIAIGRDGAGVHWRTDSVEGMKLGEQVAISILNDLKNTYNEPFSGFSLTKFDGTKITVG